MYLCQIFQSKLIWSADNYIERWYKESKIIFNIYVYNIHVFTINHLIHLFCRPKARTAASIILRGPNDFYCDEMERSIHDSLCVVKRVLESKSVVTGGGSVEAALSIYLENFATTLSSREQLAIAEFARSLLVIPKILAVNAAQDATDLVAKLRAYQNSSQTKVDHAHLKWVGLDLIEGTVRDNKKAGVLEPTISKIKSLKFATEAAITILRIDDMIKLDPEQKGGKNYSDAMRNGELYD